MLHFVSAVSLTLALSSPRLAMIYIAWKMLACSTCFVQAEILVRFVIVRSHICLDWLLPTLWDQANSLGRFGPLSRAHKHNVACNMARGKVHDFGGQCPTVARRLSGVSIHNPTFLSPFTRGIRVAC
ncbi:unnamed protein product [Mycena citricolor]|uniref:Uncharacterized protein n=1 Tax=Mycena citricolor TaxID=2018698 RepID=A0AAD2H6H7_9AGAR|nr:unnamed protein product [Mycena citricolor]